MSTSDSPISARRPTGGVSGFESAIPFRELRVHTAAVYCSDGRIGGQIDEFLHHILDTSLCDRLAVPGGPASLRVSSPVPDESRGIKQQLNFLIRAHGLRRVILIAHVPCAFYRERLGVPDDLQRDRQVGDLREAAREVRTLAQLLVDAYAARAVKTNVQFHPVSV